MSMVWGIAHARNHDLLLYPHYAQAYRAAQMSHLSKSESGLIRAEERRKEELVSLSRAELLDLR